MQVVSCAAAAVLTYIALVACGTTSSASIQRWLEGEGLTNVDVTNNGNWEFTALAFPGCVVSGYQSNSSEGWYLVGYNGPPQSGSSWPPRGVTVLDVAKEDKSVCQSGS